MREVSELCCYYIAFIRGLALVHQNSHWLTKGPSFYGDHLLYERLYKSASEDADAIAERFIGLFGADVLDLGMQAQLIGKTLEKFAGGDPIETSLKAEKEFILFAEKFYNALDKEGKLTLGLEDLLPAVASNRETSVYLLQQVAGKGNSKMAARKALLTKIKKSSR